MKDLSSIDIKYLTEEIKEELENTKIDRIYQTEQKEFSIQTYRRNREKITLNIRPNTIWMSKQRPDKETLQTGLLQQLRKHVEGGIIKEIKQINNERIIQIIISRDQTLKIIIELFGDGNLILIDDKDIIMNALEKREWKDRKILPKEKYKTPEQNNVVNMNFETFTELIEKSEKNISQTLAMNGLGKIYAEEICLRAKIDLKEKNLAQKEIKNIYEKIQEIKNEQKKPQRIYQENELIDTTPIELQKYNNHKKEEFKSFNQAIQTTEQNKDENSDKIKLDNKYKTKIEKFKKIIDKQEQELKQAEKEAEEEQKKAEKIYENYQIVKEAIDNKARTLELP